MITKSGEGLKVDDAGFDERVTLVSIVASEATEETNVIARHPEVIDALRDLASYSALNDHFGGNGHDPNAFVGALAEGLEPYRSAPLNDKPELVQGLAFLAWALQERRAPAELAAMEMFA